MSAESNPTNHKTETNYNWHWLVYRIEEGAPFNAHFPIRGLPMDDLVNGLDHTDWGKWTLARHKNPNFTEVGSGFEKYLCALKPDDVMGYLKLFERDALSSVRYEGYLTQLKKFLDNRSTPLDLRFITLMSEIQRILLARAKAIESSVGHNYFYNPDGKLVKVPKDRSLRSIYYDNYIRHHPPLVTTKFTELESGIISLKHVISKPQNKCPVPTEYLGCNIDKILYVIAEIGRFGDPISGSITRRFPLPINRRFY